MSNERTIIEVAPGLTVTPNPRSRRWESWRELNKSTRVYVSTANESILDNLVNRTSRPYKAWGDILKTQVLPALGFEDVKVRWSQKAGCSCPCSPGFILVHTHLMEGVDGKLVRTYEGGASDLWLSIDFAALDVPQVVDGPERQSRALQLGVAS